MADVIKIEEIHAIVDDSFDYDPANRGLWQLVYASRGTHFLNQHPLAQGQLMLLPPGQDRVMETDDPIAVIRIAFSSESRPLDLIAGRVLHASGKEHALIHDIAKEARETSVPGKAPFGCAQYIRLLLEALLIELIRRAATQFEQPDPPAHAFEAVVQYIEERLDSELDLESLSARSGMSASHLERLFRKFTGMSVIQYCRARRVARAKELMRAGEMSVTAIAEATGFSSVHYFSRTFKVLTGMPPREYMRAIKSMDI